MSAVRGVVERGMWELKNLINGETATKVSDPVPCAGAKRVTFLFTRADHSAGTSTFTVEVMINNVWVAYNKLLTNVANTNAQTPVRAASVALAANGSAIASMDLENDVFQEFRVTATEATDGTHSASAVIEY